jgi:hypothetical protein
MRTSSTEAIVFVHGLGVRQKDADRTRFIRGLVEVPETADVTELEVTAAGGADGVQVKIEYPDGQVRHVDVYEAFWADLVPFLSQAPLPSRMLRSLVLAAYWCRPRVLLGMLSHRALVPSLVVGVLLLVVWIAATFGLFLSTTDLKADSIVRLIFGDARVDDPGHGLLVSLTAKALALGAAVALPVVKAWPAICALMMIFPVAVVVDVADFARRFLINEPTSEEETGLRDRIRRRVRAVLNGVYVHGSYDRVWVVAHSFGTVVAVDVLADYAARGDRRIRLVTLGSPLPLMILGERWMADEVVRCARNPALERWDDFHSRQDWFCGPVPFGSGERTASHRIDRPAGLLDRLSARTHYRYLRDPEVFVTLLERPAAAAVPAA